MIVKACQSPNCSPLPAFFFAVRTGARCGAKSWWHAGKLDAHVQHPHGWIRWRRGCFFWHFCSGKMAHRNRWFTWVYLLIAWWIFPWQTVSHNQMVILIDGLEHDFVFFDILGIVINPNWRSHIFSEGWLNHQPVIDWVRMVKIQVKDQLGIFSGKMYGRNYGKNHSYRLVKIWFIRWKIWNH